MTPIAWTFAVGLLVNLVLLVIALVDHDRQTDVINALKKQLNKTGVRPHA